MDGSDSSDWETLREAPRNFSPILNVSPLVEAANNAVGVRRKLIDNFVGEVSGPLREEFRDEVGLSASPFRPARHIFFSSPVEDLTNLSLRIPDNISRIDKVKLCDFSMDLSPKASEKMAETDDDDIQIIEENGSVPKRPRKRHFDSREMKANREICTFQRQMITEHDYRTLADEEFLNDNIINFYLTYLYENLSEKHKEMIHIYSSHFYSRLKTKTKEKSSSAGQKYKTQAEKSYERVKSWTKKIDIFSKRMLIVPICEESHWYLVVVCNPGHVLSASRDKDFESKRSYQQKFGETRGSNPFIMVLDSLGATHSTAVAKIRSYLMFEHLERWKLPKNFGKDKMDEKHPPIPLQPNSCDCGLFLLHYVELIFKDPDMFLGALLPDLSKWFDTSDIKYKREDISLVIQRISNAAADGRESTKFPRLKLPARRPVSEAAVAAKPAAVAAKPAAVAAKPAAVKRRSSDPRLRKEGENATNEADGDRPKPSRFTYVPPVSFTWKNGVEAKSKRKQVFVQQSREKLATLVADSSDTFPPVHGSDCSETGPGSDSGKWKAIEDARPASNHRFQLRRNNPETDPGAWEKAGVDAADEQPVKSGKEMFKVLMKGLKKKSKRQ